MPDPTPPTAAPPTAPLDPFVRFVRCKEGKPVTRFVKGDRGGARPASFFGARRVDGRLVYDTEAVHAITEEEWSAFGRIYQRNIDDGDLEDVPREAWSAYNATLAERSAKNNAPAKGAPKRNGSATPAGG